MKITRIGWVGKTVKLSIFQDNECAQEYNHVFIEPIVYGRRGCRRDWDSGCWPPRKVRVTVEDAK